MPDDRRRELELLQAALGPGKDCPPIEALEALLSRTPGAAPEAIHQHVDTCPYCQTEMHMLRDFQSAGISPADAAGVQAVEERLRRRSRDVFQSRQAAARVPWWKSWLSPGKFTTPVLVIAGLLLAAGLAFQLRREVRPELHPPPASGDEVMRSNTIVPSAPDGDVREAPREFSWQPVPGAAQYEVRVLEVDRRELWKGVASEARLALPPAVQARVVPAKTLFWQVSAFDAGGRKLAESEPIRFRLLQNLHRP